jgi:hypothetical protein
VVEYSMSMPVWRASSAASAGNRAALALELEQDAARRAAARNSEQPRGSARGFAADLSALEHDDAPRRAAPAIARSRSDDAAADDREVRCRTPHPPPYRAPM